MMWKYARHLPEEAKRNPEVGKVYGAIGGTGAIFSETFIDLTSFDDEKLKLLLHTPASAIGSSRYPLYEKDYEKMVDIFKKHDIKYVLLNSCFLSITMILNLRYKIIVKK